MRNGHRWQVFAVDTEHNRIAARRLDDGARAAFTGDYLREHITHGYAVTVHSAQGVTADTTHAVLGENTSRNLLYVAMTRGRDTNTAYLYERIAGEGEHEHAQPTPGVHVARRGTGRDASQLVRAIIANHDEQARTAHDIAAETHDREPAARPGPRPPRPPRQSRGHPAKPLPGLVPSSQRLGHRSATKPRSAAQPQPRPKPRLRTRPVTR